MKPFQKIFLCTLFFFAFPGLSLSSQSAIFDHVTYAATTDHKYRIAWDPVPEAIHYGIRLVNLERNETIVLPPTKQTSIELTFPYSGHFTVKVRACNPEDPKFAAPCSDWAVSTDPKYSTVESEPRAWWLYGYVAPPESVDFMKNP